MTDKVETYVFGDFRFIPSESLLTKGGEAVQLPPKALRVLEKLIDNAGSLVDKDELIRDVWDDAAVEESAVSRAVFLIRTALGDDPKNHVYIQTVPKRGYRFVAKVRADRPQESYQPTPSGLIRTVRSAKRWRLLALVSVAVLFFGLAAVYVFFVASTSAGTGAKKRIAVLPLNPVDAKTADARYELGIADALILKLSSSNGVVVRPLHAVQDYAKETKDARDAGREQGVDYVLSSNYQIAEGKIRVTSQLLNVADGRVEATFPIEKPLTDLFSFQDEIASDIGGKLLTRFAVAPGVAKTRGTANEKAYLLYMQATYLSTQRRAGSLLKSLDAYEQAVQLDPTYAQAWASKAHAHILSAWTTASVPKDQAYLKSMQAIEKALSIEPELSEAYVAWCQVKLGYEYDFAGAEQVCERALELGRGSSRAHQAYSTFLLARGRADESIAEIRTATELEPTSYENHRYYANTLYYARRYDAAIAQYKQILELDPNANATYNWLVRALEAQGKESEAFEWFIKSLGGPENNAAAIHRYTTVYQESGWPGVLLERIHTADSSRSNNPFRIAGWYARAGNKDKAFEYLEKALQERAVMDTLRIEPQLDPLRDDPRYDDLVKRMNFK